MEVTTEQLEEASNNPGLLSLVIKEKSTLYAAYMPYIKGGGLFIPTNKNFKIGEEIFMLLSLVDDPLKLKLAGKVIWLTPAKASSPQGIGVQFSDKDGGTEVRKKIEAILGGALRVDRRVTGIGITVMPTTYTM